MSRALIEADAVYSIISLIISGVVFAVIGLYMMKKGVKQERPSTQC
jgi:putative Mn2+ efflux pump MntP